MNLLQKIFFKKTNQWQLLMAVIGSTVGFVFLLTTIHYMGNMKHFLKGEESLNANTQIIQKKVSNFSTLNIKKPYFEAQEIARLKDEKIILDIQEVINNTFGLTIETDGELIPYLRSDIFVQAVPASLIKIEESLWDWTPSHAFIPLVVPRDFLVLINTFASAKGLPQLSEDLIKSLSFKLQLYGGNKQETHLAKISAFTSEVSSILAPPSFIKYGNNKFAKGVNNKTTQLLVSVEAGKMGAFEKILEKKGLEAQTATLIINKLKGISGTLFSLLLLIGGLCIALSLLLFIQFANLMVANNNYEVQTLSRIGYTHKNIQSPLMRYFSRLITAIFLVSFLLFMILKIVVDSLLENIGIYIAHSYTVISFLVGVGIVLGFLAILNKFLSKRITQIAN